MMNATEARRISSDLANKRISEVLNKVELVIKNAAENGEYTASVYIPTLSTGIQSTIKNTLADLGFGVKIIQGDQREPGTHIRVDWSV